MNNYNLFDVLSMDERVLVYSEVADRIIFTWNRSCTLQCWELQKDNINWEEIGIRTLPEEPTDSEDAREKAIQWYLDGVSNERG